MKNFNFWYVALFGVLNFVGLAIGGLATGPGVSSDWYAGLDKAPWTPPGWVFGAAWTAVMLGFTWFMTSVWSQLGTGVERRTWAGWFAMAWLLNVGWNPLFFGWQEAGWALAEILALYAVIVAMARKAWSVLGPARWGIAPYVAWLTVAVSLNAYVVFNNPSQSGDTWPESRWEQGWKDLDGAVEWAVEEGQIPGAVLLVMRDGEVAVHKAYGMADPVSAVPMEKDALFRICSQSKAITATAAMILWERGQLGLDDPVSNYLPEFAGIGVIDTLRTDTSFTAVSSTSEMTVRHLMTHTCGVSYGEIGDPRFEALYEAHDVLDLFPTDGRSTRDNVRNIASTCLIHPPGVQWNYSLGLDVLVAVIEVAAQQPYAAFLQSEILEPLGMNDTHFVLPMEKAKRLANVVEPAEDGFQWKRHEHPRYSIDYPLHPEWPLCSGGAGLTSSAKDYARFLQCYLDRGATPEGRLLQASTVDSVLADQAPGLLDGGWHQGLAFGVRNGGSSAGSFFWSGYFNTSFFAQPSTKTSVVLMKQTYGLKVDSTATAFASLLWN